MAPRRRHKRPPGRPFKLLEEHVQQTLLNAMELGVPVTIACQGADISESSFYGWMQRGHSEHVERSREDGEPDDTQTAYLDLYLAVQRARAKAATRNVGVIQKAAQGGSIIEETTEKTRDPETGKIVETKTVKKSAPDWRAAAWYLERAHRGEYAKGVEQVEVTGANGGPIQVTADAEDLARRLQEHLAAGVAAPLALEAAEDDEE